MPYRFIPFVNDQYYHIYNRGSEKRSIFESRRDCQRFLKTLKYYQYEGPKPKFSRLGKIQKFEPDPSKILVEIVGYCLMPNHFHLLVKQVKNGGISEFMSKSSNSYTKYYNTKHDRVGPLLQGEFKAILVESNEQLVHLSRYIHLNPITSYIVKDLDNYEWSSYQEYLRNPKSGFCAKETVMSLFKNPQDYQQFVQDQISYALDLAFIKHQLIEEV